MKVLVVLESLSLCMELGSRWDDVLSVGTVSPSLGGSGSAGWSGPFTGVGEFLHHVVFVRRDSAARG